MMMNLLWYGLMWICASGRRPKAFLSIDSLSDIHSLFAVALRQISTKSEPVNFNECVKWRNGETKDSAFRPFLGQSISAHSSEVCAFRSENEAIDRVTTINSHEWLNARSHNIIRTLFDSFNLVRRSLLIAKYTRWSRMDLDRPIGLEAHFVISIQFSLSFSLCSVFC